MAALSRDEARQRLVEQVASWSASPCSCDVLVDNLIEYHADELRVALSGIKLGQEALTPGEHKTPVAMDVWAFLPREE